MGKNQRKIVSRCRKVVFLNLIIQFSFLLETIEYALQYTRKDIKHQEFEFAADISWVSSFRRFYWGEACRVGGLKGTKFAWNKSIDTDLVDFHEPAVMALPSLFSTKYKTSCE
jgi:hypothetical protein